MPCYQNTEFSLTCQLDNASLAFYDSIAQPQHFYLSSSLFNLLKGQWFCYFIGSAYQCERAIIRGSIFAYLALGSPILISIKTLIDRLQEGNRNPQEGGRNLQDFHRYPQDCHRNLQGCRRILQESVGRLQNLQVFRRNLQGCRRNP